MSSYLMAFNDKKGNKKTDNRKETRKNKHVNNVPFEINLQRAKKFSELMLAELPIF
jgi:hypothetical protein